MQAMSRAITAVVDRAQERKSEYSDVLLSAEHLLMALAEDRQCGKALLASAQLHGHVLKNLRTIRDMRKNTQVTKQENAT